MPPMKRILDFKNFLNENLKGKNLVFESSKGKMEGWSLEKINEQIRDYIGSTNNKGGNPQLLNKKVDEIVSIGSPVVILKDFIKSGIASNCSLDIFEKIFSGFLLPDPEVTPVMLKELAEKSDNVLNDFLPRAVSEWDSYRGFDKIFKQISTPDEEETSFFFNIMGQETINRAKENIRDRDSILSNLKTYSKILEARNSNSISDLDESEKSKLSEIFKNSISEYGNASILRSKFPGFYEECSKLVGSDEADVVADLGSFGF
jgi:hypothetical protein